MKKKSIIVEENKQTLLSDTTLPRHWSKFKIQIRIEEKMGPDELDTHTLAHQILFTTARIMIARKCSGISF